MCIRDRFIQLPAGDINAETVIDMVAAFHDAYAERNGQRFEMIPVEGVTYRVELIVPSEKVEYVAADAQQPFTVEPERMITLEYLADQPLAAGEYRREHLNVGATITGPAVIREDLSTTIVLESQTATVGRCGELIIEGINQ